MTLLEVLSKWAGLSGPVLFRALEAAAASLPDAAPTIRDWIAKLQAGLSSENIIALSGSILTEGGNIAQGKFSGKQRPSDLA